MSRQLKPLSPDLAETCCQASHEAVQHVTTAKLRTPIKFVSSITSFFEVSRKTHWMPVACNFPIGLAGLRRATFLCPKRAPKIGQKVASKNPKPKGKLLPVAKLPHEVCHHVSMSLHETR